MANHLPKFGNADFDWNDLKYALTVARHGGLSHAAKLLGTSASTVSRHIQQLESNLGQTLFLRQQSDRGKWLRFAKTSTGLFRSGVCGPADQNPLAINPHQILVWS